MLFQMLFRNFFLFLFLGFFISSTGLLCAGQLKCGCPDANDEAWELFPASTKNARVQTLEEQAQFNQALWKGTFKQDGSPESNDLKVYLNTTFLELKEFEFSGIFKILSRMTKVKHLALDEEFLSYSRNRSSLKKFDEVLRQMKNLTCFSLGGKSLSESEMKMIIGFLAPASNVSDSSSAKEECQANIQQPSSLQYLHLSNCNFGQESTHELIRVVKQIFSLKIVNFGCGFVDEKSLQELWSSLKELPLQKIVISCCKVNDEMIPTFVPFLSRFTFLQALDLCNNNIESKGAQALGTVLPFCPSLRHLNLMGNVLKETDYEVFWQVALNAPTLVMFLSIHDENELFCERQEIAALFKIPSFSK